MPLVTLQASGRILRVLGMNRPGVHGDAGLAPAGLQTGECELIDGKIGGIAVHIGSRVAAEARPREVLVSQIVRDLVAGSDRAFDDRGHGELKGVPGEWRLYAARVG